MAKTGFVAHSTYLKYRYASEGTVLAHYNFLSKNKLQQFFLQRDFPRSPAPLWLEFKTKVASPCSTACLQPAQSRLARRWKWWSLSRLTIPANLTTLCALFCLTKIRPTCSVCAGRRGPTSCSWPVETDCGRMPTPWRTCRHRRTKRRRKLVARAPELLLAPSCSRSAQKWMRRATSNQPRGTSLSAVFARWLSVKRRWGMRPWRASRNAIFFVSLPKAAYCFRYNFESLRNAFVLFVYMRVIHLLLINRTCTGYSYVSWLTVYSPCRCRIKRWNGAPKGMYCSVFPTDQIPKKCEIFPFYAAALWFIPFLFYWIRFSPDSFLTCFFLLSSCRTANFQSIIHKSSIRRVSRLTHKKDKLRPASRNPFDLLGCLLRVMMWVAKVFFQNILRWKWRNISLPKENWNFPENFPRLTLCCRQIQTLFSSFFSSANCFLFDFFYSQTCRLNAAFWWLFVGMSPNSLRWFWGPWWFRTMELSSTMHFRTNKPCGCLCKLRIFDSIFFENFLYDFILLRPSILVCFSYF